MPGSLRDISLFVAVYEARSFTAAASRENATQSGVSQHVRKLEESLDVRLFTRDKGIVAPTPAGDTYYQHCIEVLRAHEAARRSVSGYAKGFEGEIVVGLMPTMTRCVLAPVLAGFVAANPNVSVRVVEGYSAALTQHVLAGELDFAIVPAFAGAPGLRSRLFLRTPEVLVAAPSTARTHLAGVKLATAGPLKLVVPAPSNTRRKTIETYCGANGIRIEQMIELDSMMATLDMVQRSDWVTILPGIMMAIDAPGRDGPGLIVNPLTDPDLTLDLVQIEPSRRPMSGIAQAFLDALEAESQKLNTRWSAEKAKAASPAKATPAKRKISG
jgi:LysR family transcriptional regulator, nitrogen assimilation regulatory protein